METLTIKIRDIKVLKLIHHLEDLNLIQIVDKDLKESKTKLSDLLADCISLEEADNMQTELKQMRAGWERDTY
jgi:hypothetical protein